MVPRRTIQEIKVMPLVARSKIERWLGDQIDRKCVKRAARMTVRIFENGMTIERKKCCAVIVALEIKGTKNG